jgi:hypothetical protein
VFSEKKVSKTLGKNLDEKSSEALNRQTSLEISSQKKKTTADFTKPESYQTITTSSHDD